MIQAEDQPYTVEPFYRVNFSSPARETIDADMDKLLQAVEQDALHRQVYAVMFDFSDDRVGLTVYLRQRLTAFLGFAKLHQGYLAFVVGDQLTKTALSLLLRQFRQAQYTAQIFDTVEDARAWLEG